MLTTGSTVAAIGQTVLFWLQTRQPGVTLQITRDDGGGRSVSRDDVGGLSGPELRRFAEEIVDRLDESD